MTGQRTLLVLVRHGQTVWHEENRYAGVSDVGLTATGAEQARRLAVWAARERPDAVVCSPVSRAIETARPSAAALGLEPEVLDDLREVDFGIAEGRTLGELREHDAEMVHRFTDDPVNNPFPDADPPAEAASRAVGALYKLAAEYAGGTVLVIAHNTLLRLALCELLEIDLSRYRRAFPKLENGALTKVSLSATGPQVASLLELNVPLP
jgi:broad specificity phosphatase PhoE